jgi:hypothetical protein
MATLEREIRRSDTRLFRGSHKDIANLSLSIYNSIVSSVQMQTDKSRIFGYYPATNAPKKETLILQSKGYQRLIDLIISLEPDVYSTAIVENDTCIHMVAKKGEYTYHFDLYEDEYKNPDPEIVFNPFWGDKKLKARMDNLSEIEYLLNTDVEIFS